MSRDWWGRIAVAVAVCPSCGHTPAWHDAEGCTMPVNRDHHDTVVCPCARTLGNLTDTGINGGR